MLDELTGNPLWEKLSKILNQMDKDESVKLKDFHRGMLLFGEPFAEIKIARSTCKRYLQRLIFQNLQPLISSFDDKNYIAAKADYFQKYHALTLDAAKLEDLYIVMQATMIQRRADWVLTYLDTNLDNMFVDAMDSFVNEGYLSLPNDNGSILEHPEMGEHKLNTHPPLQKAIESTLVEPYKNNVKARLGISESGKSGRRPMRTQFNFMEGIVPLYRIYLKTLWKLKKIEDTGAGCIEKHFNDLTLEDEDKAKTERALYEIAKSYGDDPTKTACQALIVLHDLPYKAESLYASVLDCMKDEEHVIEVFRKLNLN